MLDSYSIIFISMPIWLHVIYIQSVVYCLTICIQQWLLWTSLLHRYIQSAVLPIRYYWSSSSASCYVLFVVARWRLAKWKCPYWLTLKDARLLLLLVLLLLLLLLPHTTLRFLDFAHAQYTQYDFVSSRNSSWLVQKGDRYETTNGLLKCW